VKVFRGTKTGEIKAIPTGMAFIVNKKVSFVNKPSSVTWLRRM